MWPFKRKKKPTYTSPKCPHCGSTHTVLQTGGEENPDYVRAWRGQRYWDYRCLDCNQSFYTEEQPGGAPDEAFDDGRTVDDEEALRMAENELKRQADNENDHTYR